MSQAQSRVALDSVSVGSNISASWTISGSKWSGVHIAVDHRLGEIQRTDTDLLLNFSQLTTNSCMQIFEE